MKLLLPVAFCFLGTSCIREQRSGVPKSGPPLMEKTKNPFATIGAIPAPKGYRREVAAAFGGWLRQLPLKKEKTVFLYNGQKKKNQQAQYAVADITTGDRDLQQCADAVIRLRAEYLFSKKIIRRLPLPILKARNTAGTGATTGSSLTATWPMYSVGVVQPRWKNKWEK
ncbi:MAG: hypothetical protein IPM85_10310 [Chitinophagaceae bacterium]|nr:hypothetical protein [Chitinophagaceae bacterium]